MYDFYVYQIEIEGQVDEKAFNTTSPLRMSVTQVGEDSTSFTVHADQSGLVGLIRHLHHQGFMLLSLVRK